MIICRADEAALYAQCDIHRSEENVIAISKLHFSFLHVTEVQLLFIARRQQSPAPKRRHQRLPNRQSIYNFSFARCFDYFDCLWFAYSMKSSTQGKVASWIKHKNVFTKKYTFVPICVCECFYMGHWSLLILCHLRGSSPINPPVPQQVNGTECGFLVLCYIYLFIKSAPHSFSINDYPYFIGSSCGGTCFFLPSSFPAKQRELIIGHKQQTKLHSF
ncbi:hypothetical protein Taro_043534 [Colocasia esculenta]|uniref:Ubiquitin-like protease family profile domain-containing protein n=1 Tax=Colocasia esculenta TaxID=4460 RepID=A0A843WZ38_COLES|nr:hypothetical protein [Colocasia esculenta]